MVLVGQRFGYQVAEEETQHLPGIYNIRCDDMSREVKGVEDIRREGGAGWEGLEDWSVGAEEMRGLFELLRPENNSISEEGFVKFSVPCRMKSTTSHP